MPPKRKVIPRTDSNVATESTSLQLLPPEYALTAKAERLGGGRGLKS